MKITKKRSQVDFRTLLRYLNISLEHRRNIEQFVYKQTVLLRYLISCHAVQVDVVILWFGLNGPDRATIPVGTAILRLSEGHTAFFVAKIPDFISMVLLFL